MYRKAKPFFLICETPLHCGSGADLGIVDLPIQRERHTDFPKVESSSLKGALREAFENKLGRNDSDIILAFGPDEGGEHSGCLGFTDARLLLFPVKSMKGVYAWITCPSIINRFLADLKLAEISPGFTSPVAFSSPSGCNLFVRNNKIILEEYTFEIKNPNNDNCTRIASWISQNVMPQSDEYQFLRRKAASDLIVLDDDEFRDFAVHSTEVITRTKISNITGTVQSGALFTEEYLPPETVMYSLALAMPVFINDKEKESKKGKCIFKSENPKVEAENVMKFFVEGISGIDLFQLGGNATIGKGLVRIRI